MAYGFDTLKADSLGRQFPTLDLTYPLGLVTNRWTSFFASALSAGGVDLILQGNAAIKPPADNALSLGASGFRWSDLRANLATFSGAVGTGPLTVTGTLTPEADNTRTLGSEALRWANLFATTISASTRFTTNTSTGIAFGGAAVGGSAVAGVVVDKVPVTVNGVTRYIPLYDS